MAKNKKDPRDAKILNMKEKIAYLEKEIDETRRDRNEFRSWVAETKVVHQAAGRGPRPKRKLADRGCRQTHE